LVAVTLSADQRINPRAARASRERLWTRAYVKNLSPEKAAELAALEYDNNNTPAGLDQEATVITIAARPRTLPTSDAEALFAGLENVEKWSTLQRIPTASSVSQSFSTSTALLKKSAAITLNSAAVTLLEHLCESQDRSPPAAAGPERNIRTSLSTLHATGDAEGG
jgi:hypothetical protein